MIAAHPYRRQMPWKPEDREEYENAVLKVYAILFYADRVTWSHVRRDLT